MIVKLVALAFASSALLAVLASSLGLAEASLVTPWFVVSFIGSVITYGMYRDDKGV